MTSIPIMRPWMGEEEVEAAAEAIRSGWVAQGPRVAQFEEAFASAVGATAAVAVSSCTTGLHLSLHLLGLGPGDEVIVPSFSFIATTNSVVYTGATPVFSDIDPLTGNISTRNLDAAITPRTRAVMIVHQAGVPADLGSVRAWCHSHELPLIEDAACAMGATYAGQPIGHESPMAVFSFHPRKILTTGEGGMIVTNDHDSAARLRRLREHGMSVSAADRHQSKTSDLEGYLEIGFNYRMTDIQAAVGIVQLGRMPEAIDRRRALAAEYHRLLSDLPQVRCVADPEWGTSNYQSFWVELLDDTIDRDRTMKILADQGISTRRGIMAAHLEPACERFTTAALPITERLTNRTIILPLYHQMTEADQERVVTALSETLRGQSCIES